MRHRKSGRHKRRGSDEETQQESCPGSQDEEAEEATAVISFVNTTANILLHIDTFGGVSSC